MAIKAIETEYNGYKFRSRLEARWAVFLDALGVDYEYEPEGFELPSGKRYLPDFKVKCYGTRGCDNDEPFDLYIEVKGNMTLCDAERIEEFAGASANNDFDIKIENPILVVGNIPQRGKSSDSDSLGAYDTIEGTHVCPFNYTLIDGDYFAAYPAAYKGRFFLWGDDSNYIWNENEVEEAYDKARKARFEYGETPVIVHGR